MEIQKAIETLKDFGKQISAKADGAYNRQFGKIACNMAIIALERRDKILPILNKYYYFCPNCGRRRTIRQKHRFCDNCGQAFYWNDEE